MIFVPLIVFSLSFVSGVSAQTKRTGIESDTRGVGKIVAFYFHGNVRCAKCKKIEQYSHEAVNNYFARELETKTLVFRTINVDLPENKHFVEDYGLITKSLVVAEFMDGRQVRWKNLAKVWKHVNDKDTFYEYVRTEIKEYLEQIQWK
jgi:hypothetical protein